MSGENKGVPWVPLESNPEVLTKYSRNLGAAKGEWIDVFALDDDSLATLPKPVNAVILLFPISESYDNYCKEQDAKIAESGQEVSKEVFFLKQYVSNACGTVGVMHALGNNTEAIQLGDDSTLGKFIKATTGMTPQARGEELVTFNQIASAHEEIATEGQTAPPPADEHLVTHFVALVHKDGNLYELDGRRVAPINHGATSPENFLKDAARICRERMERDPTEYRFTVLALTTGDVSQ